MAPVSNNCLQALNITRRPRVVYFITSMAGGGAEKMVASLLQAHDAKQFELHLLVNRFEGPYVRYIPPHVQVTELGVRRLKNAIPALMRCLRTIAPDVVISHLWENNVLTMLAKYGLRMKFATVMWEHSAISRKRRLGANVLRSWAYRNADAVIVGTPCMEGELIRLLHVPANRIKIIPNIIIDPSFYERMQEQNSHPWLQAQTAGNRIPVVIGVGRLAPPKRFDLLLQAISSVSQSRKIRAIILGEGPLREGLTAMRSELGLNDVIDFLGYIENPLPYMAKADLFVQTSDFEGHTIALIEAVACGTPIIATKTTTGTAEILQWVENAVMVPCNDSDALAQALELQLKQQVGQRMKMSHYSPNCQKALQRCTSHEVTEQCSQLIMDVLARQRIKVR